MPASIKLLALSSTTRKIYQRIPGGPWSEFPVQPQLGVSMGRALVGLPNGSIICWDGSALVFKHWDPATSTWIARTLAGQPDRGWGVGVPVGENSAVVVALNGSYTAAFNGDTNTWAYLGCPIGNVSSSDVAALSLTDIWVAGRTVGGVNFAWHWDGSSWVDYHPITPALFNGGINNIPVAVATAGGAVFFIIGNTMNVSNVVRFRAGVWAASGNFTTGLLDIWPLDPATFFFSSCVEGDYRLFKGSDGEVSGGNNFVFTSVQQQNMAVQYPGSIVKTIMGLDSQRVYVAGLTAVARIWETLDGATWTLTTGYPSDNCSSLAAWVEDSGGPPYALLVTPAVNGQTGVSAAANVVLDVYDVGVGLDPATTKLEVKIGDGDWYTIWENEDDLPGYVVTTAPIAGGLRYTINPAVNFPDWTVIQLRITAADLSTNSITVTRSFRTRDVLTPMLGGESPTGEAAPGSPIMRFALRDSQSGLKLSTLQVALVVNAAPPVALIVNGVVQTPAGYRVALTGNDSRRAVQVRPNLAFSEGDQVTVNIDVEDNEVFT